MPKVDDPAALAPIAAPTVPKRRSNSLANYKSAAPKPQRAILVPGEPGAEPAPRRRTRRKAGRKAKPKAELFSEQVALMLTPEQRRVVEAKAGLAPMGKYIRHILQTETDLFKPTKALKTSKADADNTADA